ncbi:unnamed protein product [Calicophoron daubneyi]|uniref:Uncharacterized protein n=1 Tax=Calicophoron daubneyi TaxID=300641 RepID=A0AAV2TEL2_CALDB
MSMNEAIRQQKNEGGSDNDIRNLAHVLAQSAIDDALRDINKEAKSPATDKGKPGNVKLTVVQNSKSLLENLKLSKANSVPSVTTNGGKRVLQEFEQPQASLRKQQSAELEKKFSKDNVQSSVQSSPLLIRSHSISLTQNSPLRARIRGPGVGASSPREPRLSTTRSVDVSIPPLHECEIKETVKKFKKFGSLPLLDLTSFANDEKEPEKDPVKDLEDAQRLTYRAGPDGYVTYCGSTGKVDLLTELDRKLQPLNQSLPTYIPSRVFLRTLNQNILHFYSPRMAPPQPRLDRTWSRRSVRTDSSYRPLRPEERSDLHRVPRLNLPHSPKSYRSVPRANSNSDSRRSIKLRMFSNKSMPIVPRCTKLSLSWWQPLKGGPIDVTSLPQPRPEIVRKMAANQDLREAKIMSAIVSAERTAREDRRRYFEEIRRVSGRSIRRKPPRERRGYADRTVLMEAPGKNSRLQNRNSHLDPECDRNRHEFRKTREHLAKRQASREQARYHRRSEKHRESRIPHAVRTSSNHEGVRRPWESCDTLSRRLLSPDNRRPHRRVMSSSTLEPTEIEKYTYPMRGPTCTDKASSKKTESLKRETPFVQMHSSSNRFKDKAASRPERGPKEGGRVKSLRALGTRKQSLTDYSTRGRSIEPDRSLDRLRNRCHSIDMKVTAVKRPEKNTERGFAIEQKLIPDSVQPPVMLESTGRSHESQFPLSDTRIEALSSANRILRRRLEELQVLQNEREMALRRARVMVDDLLSKQKLQAELIRSSTKKYARTDTSTWSLCPSDTTLSGLETPSTLPNQYQGTPPRFSPSLFTPYVNENEAEQTFSHKISEENFKDYRNDSVHSTALRLPERKNAVNNKTASTHQLLSKLRTDYADLAKSVSRIEKKAKEAALSVRSLMDRGTPREPITSSIPRFYGNGFDETPRSFVDDILVDPSIESRLKKARHTLDLLRSDSAGVSPNSFSDYRISRGRPILTHTDYPTSRIRWASDDSLSPW